MEPLTLPEKATDVIKTIKELEEVRDNTENSINRHKNELRAMLGDSEIGYAGDYKVTWKQQAGRTSIDSKRLKAEDPEMYNKYMKQGAPTRVLRIA